MDTKTGTLTDFLLARISEDEALVADWCDDEPNAWNRPEPWRMESAGSYDMVGMTVGRARAECEAKRKILHLHRIGANDYETSTCHTWYGDGDGTERDLTCPTMRALALPYADHPDFRDEWRL